MKNRSFTACVTEKLLNCHTVLGLLHNNARYPSKTRINNTNKSNKQAIYVNLAKLYKLYLAHNFMTRQAWLFTDFLIKSSFIAFLFFESSFCPLWLLFSTSTAWLYYFRLSVVWECENFWKWLQLCHTCCLSTYDTELYSSLTFICPFIVFKISSRWVIREYKCSKRN